MSVRPNTVQPKTTPATRDLLKLAADATDSQATVREWLDALSASEIATVAAGYLPLTGGTLTGGLTATGYTARNGLTPTTIDLFGTDTSDTSFEKLRIGYSSADGGYLISQEIGSAGGTARDIKIGRRNAAGLFTSALTINAVNTITISNTLSLANDLILSGGTQVTWASKSQLRAIHDNGTLRLANNNASSGINFDVRTDGTLKIWDRSLSTAGHLDCGDLTASGTSTIIPPTSDPGIAGALWNNGGTLAISAG